MLYLRHYGLREKPFQDIANPIFFWFGEGQSEAIAILKFGIGKGEGITVLTGDVGIGKTTFAKYLTDHLKSKFNTVKIDDSEIESLDFLYFEIRVTESAKTVLPSGCESPGCALRSGVNTG